MSDFNFFAKKYKLLFFFSVINIFLSFLLIKILALDIVSIVDYILSGSNDINFISLADINDDGTVDVLDIVQIVNIILS